VADSIPATEVYKPETVVSICQVPLNYAYRPISSSVSSLLLIDVDRHLPTRESCQL